MQTKGNQKKKLKKNIYFWFYYHLMKKNEKKPLFLEGPHEIIQTPNQFFFLKLKTKVRSLR